MRHGFCVNQCVFGQPSPAGTRPPPARPRDPPGHAGAPGGGGRRRRAVDRAREGTAGGGAGAQAAGRARDGMVGGGGRQAAGRRGTGRRVRRRATSRGGPGARRGGRRRAGGRRAVSRADRTMGRETRADQRGMAARGAVFAKKARLCAAKPASMESHESYPRLFPGRTASNHAAAPPHPFPTSAQPRFLAKTAAKNGWRNGAPPIPLPTESSGRPASHSQRQILLTRFPPGVLPILPR